MFEDRWNRIAWVSLVVAGLLGAFAIHDCADGEQTRVIAVTLGAAAALIGISRFAAWRRDRAD
jgi:hypothetical protein